ncbi:hypothetical protein SK128_004518 [Halocaridina rubra]|uniref:Uncharacterized protein n=1 Tax=Halocaridina rubra TaxID=373956 RepID=A0AAN8ZSZ8_HALRR
MEVPPKILVSLDISRGWVPFLEEVLQGITKQNYPKERIDLWVQTKFLKLRLCVGQSHLRILEQATLKAAADSCSD